MNRPSYALVMSMTYNIYHVIFGSNNNR